MSFHCPYCNKEYTNFISSRQISAHILHCERTNKHVEVLKEKLVTQSIQLNQDKDMNTDFVFDNSDDNQFSNIDNENVNSTLYEKHIEHCKSNYENTFGSQNPDFHSAVILMDILQKSGCPLKVFDEIIEWTK